MAKGLVEYSKQRDASGGQDKWAKLKDWKDPMGGNASWNKPLAGNTPLKNGSIGKGTSVPKGLNKPSDSRA